MRGRAWKSDGGGRPSGPSAFVEQRPTHAKSTRGSGASSSEPELEPELEAEAEDKDGFEAAPAGADGEGDGVLADAARCPANAEITTFRVCTERIER